MAQIFSIFNDEKIPEPKSVEQNQNGGDDADCCVASGCENDNIKCLTPVI
jgi:hypothetical protein